MDKKQNKFIAVAYKLYAAGEKSLEFIEEKMLPEYPLGVIRDTIG